MLYKWFYEIKVTQCHNSVYLLILNLGALHRQDTNRITNIKGIPYVSIDLEVGYLVSFTLMHHYTITLPLIVIDHSLPWLALLMWRNTGQWWLRRTLGFK